MRFRKRIQIAPGVKLNISKSGVSTSFGKKGASISVGKQGTFFNYGIPGTGLYNRKKINYGPKKAVQQKNSFSATSTPENMQVEMKYKEDGSIDFFNNGVLITDRNTISTIKNSTNFKVELERLNQIRLNQIRQIEESYTMIQNGAAKIAATPKEAKKKIKCIIRKERPFGMLPSDDILMEEANRSVNTLKIWKKKELCEKYIAQKKMKYFADKAAFEENERKRVAKENAFFRQQYETELKEFDAILAGDENVLEEKIINWLSKIVFPFEFNLEFDIQGDRMYIDLDLPEIEDMPAEKAVQMATGVVKIKNKSKAEMKKEYSDCVFGLLIYFASHIFRIAVNVSTIILSAYTQRRDKEGRITDEYIVSVKFDRETFSRLSYDNPARDNCMLFENACKQNADLGFKKITPFE